MKKNLFIIGISMLLFAITGCPGNNNDPDFTPDWDDIDEIPFEEEEDEFAYIPAGTFTRFDGSVGSVGDRVYQEVTLTRNFLMCRHEVTQKEYEEVLFYDEQRYPFLTHMEQRPSINEDITYDDQDRSNHPVNNLCWSHAVAYCQALSIKEGLTPCYKTLDGKVEPWDLYQEDVIICDFDADGYRLPTEAEWEYAARAGKDGEYVYSGGNFRQDISNWGDIHPVSVKSYTTPNSFGLYDISGNVREFVFDYAYSRLIPGGGHGYTYTMEPYNEEAVTDPVVEYDTSKDNSVLPGYAMAPDGHGVRGGSCYDMIDRCYADARNAIQTTVRVGHVDQGTGFRVVRTVKE